MGLFSSYKKEGKGIEKTELRPIRPLYFFQLFFRKFWKICQLNLLYVLLTIPIWLTLCTFLLNDEVTYHLSIQLVGQLVSRIGLFMIIFSPVVGPATAGMTHVLGCFATETPVFMYAEFFEQFKKNFKQATLWSVLNGLFVLSLSYTMAYADSPLLLFGNQSTMFDLWVPLLVANTVFTCMTYYAYTMMVTFELKFKDILKNSFIFAIGRLPLSIFICALVCAFCYVAYLRISIGLMLTAVILYALCGFLAVFSVYPTIEKHMLIPAKKRSQSEEKQR